MLKMLTDLSGTKYSEISSNRYSPRILGCRTSHRRNCCDRDLCGWDFTHGHCRICDIGISQTANVAAHNRVCISSPNIQQKECGKLTPYTDSTLTQHDVLQSTQSCPYSPTGEPDASLPSSSSSQGTKTSTKIATQQSTLFNFVIPTQSSQYSGVYSSQTVFTNSNLFSPSSFNSYGQLDPAWMPQSRLIPPGVHSSSTSSEFLGSGVSLGVHHERLDSSSPPPCCGRIGSVETTAIGMCSPLTAEAYKIVSKEFQTKIDSQNWYCNSQSVVSFNSQSSSCKFSDPVTSCSFSWLVMEQSDLKTSEECINVDNVCFEMAKTDLRSDLKDTHAYTSCVDILRKSVEVFDEAYEPEKGQLDQSKLSQTDEDTVDLELHSEESDIIVEVLESDETSSTTLDSKSTKIILTRCLVCNKSPSAGNDLVKINGEMPVMTVTSQVSLLTKLWQVVDDDNFNKLTDSLICFRCLNLINVVDELEIKLESAKKELVDIYKSRDSTVVPVENLDKRNLPDIVPRVKSSCDICNKKFSSVNYLKKHKKRHAKVLRYCCEYCGKGFPALQKFESHLVRHKKSTRFQCELCGKRFIHKQYLNYHLKKHKGEFDYKCDVCGKGFIRKAGCKVHLKTHSSDRCVCHHCGKQFKNLTYLGFHIKICSGDLNFKCGKCDKKFPVKSLLTRHISVTHDSQYSFACTLCKKGFARESELKAHMRSHSDKKTFECPECNKCYKSLSNLNQHSKIHLNLKGLQCRMCGRHFTRMDSLKDHMNQHTGDKPYKCETCSKTFSHRINFNIHLKRHSGTIRKTPCPICGRQFVKGLKDHLLTHSGNKPHKCTHCEKDFTVRSSLNKHMKTKHNL